MPNWVGIVVNFVPPPIGLAHYLWLRRRMTDRRLRWLAFWCYFSYGGLLQTVLTALFWYWSGMASLGFAYLVLIATPGLPIAGFRLGPRLPAEPMKAPFVLAAKLFPLVLVGSMLALAVIR
ncbi:MAG TPA: hypothetical protein VNV25_25080 [Gemmatimonadaceae bacterium]|jgi:hypothetical protein|nr:hypothetical protein [Gemmatimonadaceae bacterium]